MTVPAIPPSAPINFSSISSDINLKNLTPATNLIPSNGYTFLSTGANWNSSSGQVSMSAGFSVNSFTNNVNPPKSKISFFLSSNGGALLEKAFITSDGLFQLGAGGIFGSVLDDTYNSMKLRCTTAATSASAQFSNKFFLEGRSWNSGLGDIATNGYIQSVTITNNANPTVESIQIAPGSGSASAATPYFKITSQGFCSIGNGTPAGLLDVFNSSGNRQFVISNTASAVNYCQVTGAITGGGPQILGVGSDANIPLNLFAKGTGAVRIGTGTTAISFQVANVASQVNYLQASGSATTVAPSISAGGTDTNIDILISPKGTGNVQFGTYTATADAPITGYITIKDSTGTARKLAIIT